MMPHRPILSRIDSGPARSDSEAAARRNEITRSDFFNSIGTFPTFACDVPSGSFRQKPTFNAHLTGTVERQKLGR